MDYSNLTATVVLSKIMEGEIRVLDYVDELLKRCERYKDLNAFIFLDPEIVREAARRADSMSDSGDNLGLLHGLPIVLKDNIDTADMPTTAGTPALKNHRPLKNAPIVQSLLDAGAIIFGKANLHELAQGVTNNNTAFGPARNPYDKNFIPGGSSGGCGVAVGARLVPVGIGTDTGGSVRIPSSLCGLVGFRPTIGRYSQAGIVPVSHTRDTAGPMTRSVMDAALLDMIIAGKKSAVKPVKLKGMRIGVPRLPFYENIHPAVSDAIEAVLGRLTDYGIELIEADLPNVFALNDLAGFPIALYESVADLNLYLAEHRSTLDFSSVVKEVASPDVKSILEKELSDAAISEELYLEALNRHRSALQAAYSEYFAEHRLSALVFPTTPLPATPIGKDKTVILNGETVPLFNAFIRNTSPSSVAGIPGLSFPVGISPDNLPIGMEIEGRFGDDDGLMEIALAIEELEPAYPAPVLP
ncbi:MAG: indoleacetamide hydrolase [Deltaproteobacteria bacterium]|nr:indoleacetamide hydrolase [Deltaproteobacteria bacterium]